MKDIYPTTGVHKYVRQFVSELNLPQEAKALDCPAGDGRASFLLNEKGYQVLPFDLYPEFFKLEDLNCQRADLSEKFPVDDASVDFIICEEGIEHLPDQLKVLQEFNRLLNKNGSALITTPSFSHLRSRFSYLLGENEYFKRLPPNEVDSIWYSEKDEKIYYGHIFLMNANKLRTLAILAGFEVEKVCWTDISSTSALLFPIVYPLSIVANFLAYLKACKKRKPEEKALLKEVLKLNLKPQVLLCKHLMFHLRKKSSVADTATYLKQFST